MRHTCSAAWARGSVGRRLSHETQLKTVVPAIGALRGAMNGKDIRRGHYPAVFEGLRIKRPSHEGVAI